ncbi:MAG: hypothetical protein IMF11_19535 [Proteobacteria bacterium]|nr:hypothetical protein [Pseudomonadota bacterium]
MKHNQLTIATPLLLFFIFFLSLPALAGYTIVPMQFTLSGKPGETVTCTMKAENMGEETVSIKISTKDFIKGLYGEERQVEPGTVKRGCAGWIRISPQKLDLAPHETRTINFSMTVPMDGRGTYWGNILVSQVSKPTLSKTIKKGETSFQIFALQDMLIRVLENVPGTEQKKGVITDISVKDQKTGGKATVEVIFENQGNNLLKCAGRIQIRDENGETVRTIPMEYGHAPFTVYPEGRRVVHGHIKEKLPPGDYILLAIIDYGGEDLVAGEMEFEVPCIIED